jgi:carbon monoxide dehydrogenase subunit G
VPSPATIVSETTVDRPPAVVHDLLDDLAAHAGFTDHYITGWELSGPTRGVGASARVKVKGGRSEIVVVESSATRIVEHGTGGPRGRWRTTGTYELEPAGAGTRVRFTNTMSAPTAPERLLAGAALRGIRKDNDRALARLKAQLEGTSSPARVFVS